MGEKLLVVDDTDLSRQLLRKLLEFHGYVVIEAADGEKAIELALEHRPALILLDIRMPVMDGFDTIASLRSKPALAGVKVVAITSFAMRGDRERMLAAGFDDYISKPVDIHEVPVRIRELLGNRG